MNLTEQKAADHEFFAAVLKQPTFAHLLETLGIDEHRASMSQRNAVFVLSKQKRWTLQLPNQTKALSIHFEARKRWELRLEVGLREYEGHIEHKQLLSHLQPTLILKARVIDELRMRTLSPISLPAAIVASDKNLRPASATDSHTAVKFTGGLSADPSVADATRFFQSVIEALTTVVDTVANSYFTLEPGG